MASNFGDLRERVGYAGVLATALLAVFLVGGLPWGITIWVLALLVFLEVAQYTMISRQPSWTARSSIVRTATILLALTMYVGLLYAGVLREQEGGAALVISLAMGVVATDSFAYLGGRLAGDKGTKVRNKWVRSASPNKTREGFLLGYVLGFGVSFLALQLAVRLDAPLSVEEAAMVALLLPIVAIIGDLLASRVKRLLGIDDFSNILGAHGGVADRFDAMAIVFATHGLFDLVYLS